MKPLMALLIIAVLILGWELRRQGDMLAEQGKQLTEKTRLHNLELQEKCARQAREVFKGDGLDKAPFASFSNHYNEKLNKCFVLLENHVIAGEAVTSTRLDDAFEGKVFGNYLWQTEKNKKYWEVPPLACNVVLESGEEKVCKSSEEFNQLIKPYMGEPGLR